MNRILSSLFLVAIVVGTVDARLVPAWGIAKLFRESDLVLDAAPIAVRSTPERNNALVNPEDMGDVAVVTTTFKILGFLKGKPASKQIDIEHYELTTQGLTVGNGPNLPNFRNRLDTLDDVGGPFSKATCLLFLRSDKAGTHTFVTGQYDSVYSVKLIENFPDSAVEAFKAMDAERVKGG